MAVLFISKGDYQVTATDITDTLAGGSSGGNIRWFSGTAFYGELDHANTGNRVYTFPNATGTVPLINNTQTWSSLQTFNTGTLKANDLLFAVHADRKISQTGGEFQLRAEAGAVFGFYINSSLTYTLTATTFDAGGKIISNFALLQGNTSTNQIDDTTSGWIFNVASGDNHIFRINSVEWLNIGSSGNIVMSSPAGSISLKVGAAGKTIGFNDGTGDRITYDYTTDDFSPLDNISSLGKTGRRWTEVWALNGTIQTSFSRFKKNIEKSDCNDCMNLCRKIEPIRFQWKDELFDNADEQKAKQQRKHIHMGINADILKEILPEAVAGEDGVYQGALIGMLLGAIKNMDERIKQLEQSQ